jgi:hypothetical protein
LLLLLDASMLRPLVLEGVLAVSVDIIFESIFYYGYLHCTTTSISTCWMMYGFDVVVVELEHHQKLVRIR